MTISVCPDEPATDKVVIYAVIAGNPPLAEVVSGLRGEVGGMHVVRELGVFEDPPDGGRRLVPVLAAIVACRRAICDRETRSHTLVDILIDLPVGILPTTVMFDVYLQLREICPNVRLTLELLDGETVLSSGTLGLQRAATAGAPEITAALDIALPSMEATVSRTGVHLLRVRSGDTMLGEHPLNVRIAT